MLYLWTLFSVRTLLPIKCWVINKRFATVFTHNACLEHGQLLTVMKDVTTYILLVLWKDFIVFIHLNNPIPPRPTHQPLSIFLPFFLKPMKFNICHSHMLRCVACHWSKRLSTLLQKIHSPSPSSYLLPKLLLLGVWLISYSSPQAVMLSSLESQKPYACYHNLCEVPYCVQNSVFPCCHTLNSYLFYNVPITLGEVWYWCPFMDEKSAVSYSLHLILL